jgi:Arc/MetJ-type ribon-helix-helix transcriptional regulator
MEFKKITITIPENLYNEAMLLIKSGMFSNLSDIVRSGIREEFKEMHPILREFDERVIYNDKELVEGVQQSRKEAQSGKGVKLKSEKEMDTYFEAL